MNSFKSFSFRIFAMLNEPQFFKFQTYVASISYMSQELVLLIFSLDVALCLAVQRFAMPAREGYTRSSH